VTYCTRTEDRLRLHITVIREDFGASKQTIEAEARIDPPRPTTRAGTASPPLPVVHAVVEREHDQQPDLVF
jgi:hypothetical protein